MKQFCFFILRSLTQGGEKLGENVMAFKVQASIGKNHCFGLFRS
ncbi:hypothetical protein V6Z11_A10G098400 [Gossypium hirsutum]